MTYTFKIASDDPVSQEKDKILKEDHTKDYPSLFDFFIRLDMVSDEKIFK
jgi:hypothetical protein